MRKNKNKVWFWRKNKNIESWWSQKNILTTENVLYWPFSALAPASAVGGSGRLRAVDGHTTHHTLSQASFRLHCLYAWEFSGANGRSACFPSLRFVPLVGRCAAAVSPRAPCLFGCSVRTGPIHGLPGPYEHSRSRPPHSNGFVLFRLIRDSSAESF